MGSKITARDIRAGIDGKMQCPRFMAMGVPVGPMGQGKPDLKVMDNRDCLEDFFTGYEMICMALDQFELDQCTEKVRPKILGLERFRKKLKTLIEKHAREIDAAKSTTQ